MADLQSKLLTNKDIQTFTTPSTLTEIAPEILHKIGQAATLLKSSYRIDKTKYDRVYVTSDIHTDVLKLDNIVSNLGLVTKSAIEGSLDSLYDKIHNMEWLPERTLLIFVGDIVDGHRKEGSGFVSSIPDTVGNIELLLHAYIYNLRIKARAKGSEVLFTIGNHDYHSVIKEEENDKSYFHDMFVHPEANRFFGSRTGRRNCLLPFYNCCPYLMLDLGEEIAFIHGGFLGYNQDKQRWSNHTNIVKDIQNKIDFENNFAALNDVDNNFLSFTNPSSVHGYEFSPLWSRAYASLSASDVCPSISPYYKMIVVGHCQMPLSCGLTSEHTLELLNNHAYLKHNCGGLNGCVVLGCESEFGPQLAFVDIAFSRTFSGYLSKTKLTNKQEFDRRAEVLCLIHDKSLDYTERYYNVIVRKNAGSVGVGSNEIMWMAFTTEVYKIINAMKLDIRDASLEFIRSDDYDWVPEETYETFTERLKYRYSDIIKANNSLEAGNTKIEVYKIIKNYINFLYRETFEGTHVPTPLHYVAIDMNEESLKKLLMLPFLDIEWFFLKLPFRSHSIDFYERYKKDNLIDYEFMDFLKIVDEKIRKEKNPEYVKRLYNMKIIFIKFLFTRDFENKDDRFPFILDFFILNAPTILQYTIIKGDQQLFTQIMNLNPPLEWIDRKLPESSAKDFYAKYLIVFPIKFANKSARGILDIQIREEKNAEKAAILQERKIRLLKAAAKPKTVRTMSTLYYPALAIPGNAEHLHSNWRKTLGLAKKGGRRRTRRRAKAYLH